MNDPKLKAALLRFAKGIAAAGIATAAGAVLLALKQDPGASASFVADAAASGFIAGVILAAEKYLNFDYPDPTPAPPAP